MTADPPLAAEFGRLPERQRDVLGMIAINQDGGHHPATLRALEKCGLIESYTETQSDHIGVFHITRYRVPFPVHMAWCAWCSTQVDEEETE